MNINSRTDLARYFNELGFKVGAEIGVAKGAFSETLCKEIPGLKLYCVDPWDSYHGNHRGGHKDKQFANYEIAKERLSKYNTILMREKSMDAVKKFEDGSLDFVFIDANHDYSYVKEDIEEWSKKVRKGGIVSGHDFYIFRNSGVIEAVIEYAKKNNLSFYLTSPDIKKNSLDDKHPSFYWFK